MQMHQSTLVTARLPRPINVMGVNVTPFDSYAHALECVAQKMATGGKSLWAAINPQKIHRAWHDPDLKAVLDRVDVGICDGIGVSLAAKILYGATLRRCTGCDLFFKIMPLAQEKGWRVFLLGASPQANAGACARLMEQYPSLRIAGSQDGYFKDDRQVVGQINDSGAEMLFVAMGSPRQENWIIRHMDQINARFFMGVGGTFDVASGLSKRAPKLFLKTGTEFLYQLATQPWRWRRQIVYTPFMLRVLGRKVFGPREQA
jgi:N-acetylglucosaminyldiphosphoundecaprenol N-acetyl-beta-D-mannosaminyltransferase